MQCDSYVLYIKKQLLWPKHVWVFHSHWYDAFWTNLAANYNVPPECDV